MQSSQFRFLIVGLLLLSPTISFSDEMADQEFMWKQYLPLDMTANEHYFILHFIPRFKQTDCMVRLKYSFSGAAKNSSQFHLDLGFRHYFSENEPSAFFYSQHALEAGQEGIVYYIFIDSCPRRFEMLHNAARFVESKDPHYTIIVDDKPVTKWPTESNDIGFWIDSPQYDPEYWRLFKKALQGDGEAMFHLAGYDHEAVTPPKAYISYAMAVDRLPEGPLRDLAIKRREESWLAVPLDKRDMTRNGLEHDRKKLRSFLDSIGKE